MNKGSTFRRDLVAAYAASGAKVASWAIVSAVLYRVDRDGFAIMALVRGTIGLLNYSTLGLAPAVVRMLAQSRHPDAATEVADRPADAHSANTIYANAIAIITVAALIALLALTIYAAFFTSLHRVPESVERGAALIVLGVGVGLLLRLTSDVPGAVLQSTGKIARDNWILAITETGWLALGAMWLASGRSATAVAASGAYAASGLIALVFRGFGADAALHGAWRDRSLLHRRVLRALISFGSLLTVAQLADFLYAPCDLILINRFIGPAATADYAPLLQIDAALLLLVTAIASVLLPRAAIAHSQGRRDALRRYYVTGTLASGALLFVAAFLIWLISPWLLRAWLGRDVAAIQLILPLVLTHTVIGGSSAPGRAILIGMGKVRPLAIAAIIAGITNVVASYALVRFTDLGLRGIVLGTIVAVVGRCALWMPWYVRRSGQWSVVSGR